MWSKALILCEKKKFSEKVFLSEENYEKSFYCAIKPAIYVGKCFGLFPIDISSTQPHEVTFHWKSFKCAFSIVYLICIIITGIFALKSMIAQGPLTPSNMNGIIFFGTVIIIWILFFGFARNFQMMMVEWSKVELMLKSKSYNLPATHWKLKKKIRVALCLSLTLALAEHSMALAEHGYKIWFEVKHCNVTNFDPMGMFIKKQIGFMVDNLPFAYNNFEGAIAEYLNFSYTFQWNFLDIFTILISIGLNDLFDRLNFRLEQLHPHQMDEDTWSEIRVVYVQLCELVTTVNRILGVTYVVSYMNDGYFILIQMLNVTNSLPFVISQVYFWVSLLYLVARTSASILIGAQVYENARRPLEVIRTVPSEMWCGELQRFFEQIKVGASALSGKNFFIIRRNLLFSMAGMLITYELVLLQFDSGEITWEDVIDCNSAT